MRAPAAGFARIFADQAETAAIVSYHMPVISMVWISSAQKVELWVIFFICQNSALKLSAYIT